MFWQHWRYKINKWKIKKWDISNTGIFLSELPVQPKNAVSVDLKYKEHIVSFSVNTSYLGGRKKIHSSISIWSKNITVLISCAILCDRCILWFKKSNCGTGRVKRLAIFNQPVCAQMLHSIHTCDHVLSAAFSVFIIHCWNVEVPNAVSWVLNKSVI